MTRRTSPNITAIDRAIKAAAKQGRPMVVRVHGEVIDIIDAEQQSAAKTGKMLKLLGSR